MTKLKFCGLSREQDIIAVNELKPDYIGFVFAKKSKRFVSSEQAAALKNILSPEIKAIGVFVNEEIETVARLLEQGVIDVAQLHGCENNSYIADLKALTGNKIIQAFKICSEDDVAKANSSAADCVLLDGGAGDGKTFDYSLIKDICRPYFLAGGLTIDNLPCALSLKPYALDVSSGIESDGVKDFAKMKAFIQAARKN